MIQIRKNLNPFSRNGSVSPFSLCQLALSSRFPDYVLPLPIGSYPTGSSRSLSFSPYLSNASLSLFLSLCRLSVSVLSFGSQTHTLSCSVLHCGSSSRFSLAVLSMLTPSVVPNDMFALSFFSRLSCGSLLGPRDRTMPIGWAGPIIWGSVRYPAY